MAPVDNKVSVGLLGRNGRGEYTVLLESIDGSDPNSCTLFTVCGEFTICATGLFALLLESM